MMEEAVSCGFGNFELMGLILGGMIASISYSLYKDKKPNIEKQKPLVSREN